MCGGCKAEIPGDLDGEKNSSSIGSGGNSPKHEKSLTVTFKISTEDKTFSLFSYILFIKKTVHLLTKILKSMIIYNLNDNINADAKSN